MTQSIKNKARCIEATAGSGKTTLMVNELCSLITEQKVSPESCLAITFTEKAASEMKIRLVSQLNKIKVHNPLRLVKRMNIETIHSFCNRLLKRHCLNINLSPHYEIISGIELNQRLKHHIANLWQSGASQPEDWLVDCLSTWSLDQWSKMLISAYHHRDTIEYWFNNGFHGQAKSIEDHQQFQKFYHQKCISFQMAYKEFTANVNQDKTDLNWIDHDDILFKTYQLLSNVDWLRHDLQDQLNHIFVDEFQDTSPIQWKIVNLLCGENDPYSTQKLVVVGDRCQAIYGFRGADDALMEMVINTSHPCLEHIKNNNNYRSHPAIIQFINQLFSRLFTDQGASFLAMEPKKEPLGSHSIRCQISEDHQSELDSIEAYIRKMETIPLHDIAILVRKNYDAQRIKAHLERVNIPVQVSKGAGLCELDIIQVIICFIQGWLDQDNELVWFSIAKDILKLDLIEIQRGILDENPLGHYLIQTNKTVAQWNNQINSGALLDQLIAMIWQLPIDKSPHDEMAMHRFIHEFKAQWQNVSGDIIRILPWLDNCIENPKILGVENDAMENAVQIMTLHAAKGLEFPVVIVPFLNAQFNMGALDPLLISRSDGMGISIPQCKDNPIRSAIYQGQKEASILEELRLFYVTLTRAKSHIFMSGQTLKRKNSSRLTLMLPYLIKKSSDYEFDFPYELNSNLSEIESKKVSLNQSLNSEINIQAIDSFFAKKPLAVSSILDAMTCPKMMHLKQNFPMSMVSSDAQLEGEEMHQQLANAIAMRKTIAHEGDPEWLKNIIFTSWYQRLIKHPKIRLEQPFEFNINEFQIRGRFDLICIDELHKTFQIVEFKRSLKGDLHRYHLQVNIYAEILQRQLGFKFNSQQSLLVDLLTSEAVKPQLIKLDLFELMAVFKQRHLVTNPNACNQCEYHQSINDCSQAPIVLI
ncbi:MAG: UvrD-helicase domain-containing protein [Candidatus Margulisiibacteriota bacterium]